MKKLIIVMIAAVLLLSACNKESNTTETEIEVNNSSRCEQSIFFSGHSDIAVSENGYYSLSTDINGFYLTYIDKNSKKEIYLCGKPECNHIDEKSNIVSGCDACVGYAIPSSIVYDNGYVYVLGYNNANRNVTLMRISGDGSTHEEIMVVGQAPDMRSYYQYLFVDADIYMVYREPQYEKKEYTITIDKIDVEKKEKSTIYSKTGIDVDILRLKYFDGALYFVEVESKGEDIVNSLVCYDMETGAVATLIDKNIETGYTISRDDKLYYSVYNEGVYCYDMQNKTSKLIRECDELSSSVTLAHDGTYLYIDNFGTAVYSDSIEHILYMCDGKGNVIEEISAGVMPVKFCDGEYIYQYDFPQRTWACISREDLLQSGKSWTPIYK